MSFADFLNQAWSDHATQAEQVANRFPEAMQLIEKGEQISQMAQLINHVMGEHLGKWDRGIEFLNLLKRVPSYSSTQHAPAVERAVASLELAAGKRNSLNEFSNSDQIRILAVAASSLSGQNQSERAQQIFHQALELANSGLSKEDPANQALAITGNNLACALEEKSDRNKKETQLMILAAETGRKYWEVAGNWLHVQRAEYRLSQSYLKAGDLTKSLEHAEIALDFASKNNADPMEFFFAYEAIALVEKATGNGDAFAKAYEQAKANFVKLSDEDKVWIKASLEKLSD